MKYTGFVLFLFAITLKTEAQTLPDNFLFLADDVGHIANITEDEFNQIIDRGIELFRPFAVLQKAKLEPSKDWKNATVNAYAQQSQDTWSVSFYGGLARRDELTRDGFQLVVCHELGHHFGGFPFYASMKWAAAEGEADYFAAQTCSKLIWADEKEINAGFRKTAPLVVRKNCDKIWEKEDNQNLCYRTVEAGLSLATLLGALSGANPPKYETPDVTQVAATIDYHPKAQCRLDTFFNGILCLKGQDLHSIPGKNHPAGQTSEEAEKEAFQASCFASQTNSVGARPRCWFKPRLMGE